jgi:hypothetical protein
LEASKEALNPSSNAGFEYGDEDEDEDEDG